MDTQSALAELKECLKELNIDYQLLQTDKDVRIQTIRESVMVDCWWDADEDVFGFTMLQGGVKKYKDIEQFKGYFSIYINLNTIFIPNTKKIADMFEKQEEIQTIYRSFKGNEQTGYHSFFNVLGDDSKEVVVSTTDKPHIYLLRYISKQNASDTQGKVEWQGSYKVEDNGEVRYLADVNTYMGRLNQDYADNSNITINRVGISNFDYIYTDITVSAMVVFDEGEISYLLTNVNGDLEENIKVVLDDPYDLAELHQKARDILAQSGHKPTASQDDEFEFEETSSDTQSVESEDSDDDFEYDDEIINQQDEPVQSEESEQENPEDETSDTEDIEDTVEETQGDTISEDSVSKDTDTDSESDEDIQEDTSSDETIEVDTEPESTETENISEEDIEDETTDSVDTQEIPEDQTSDDTGVQEDTEDTSEVEPTQEVESESESETEPTQEVELESETEATTDTDDICVKAVLVGDKPTFIRVDKGTEIFDIPVEKTIIPLDFIVDSVVKYKKKGLNLTDEERNRRVFAKIVKDEAEIKKLEDLIF